MIVLENLSAFDTKLTIAPDTIQGASIRTTKAPGLRFAAEGLMKDAYHYTQEGYNLAGTEAGKNTAYYINTGKEPSMYDPEYNNTYTTDETV